MKRVIARIDVKNDQLIKTVQLEGLRVVGEPRPRMMQYYEQGIDELIYMDIVASLYGLNSLFDLISSAAQSCFIPLTVGGGIRCIDDARQALDAGADKVAVNTAALQKPKLISELAKTFGSQAVVLSLEAKSLGLNKWHAYYDNGREDSGRDAIDWLNYACDLGAGEVLVTSVDREGTRKGFDHDLMAAISDVSPIPVICSGGYGEVDHGVNVLSMPGIDAMAVADCLHFDRTDVVSLKKALSASGIKVRL